MSLGRGAYRGDELTVRADPAGGDPIELARGRITASADLAAELGLGALARESIPAESAGIARAAALVPRDARRPDGYLLRHQDGTFGRVQDGAVVPHAVPKTQQRELALLLELRDTYLALVEAEAACSRRRHRARRATPPAQPALRHLRAGVRADQPVQLAARPHPSRDRRDDADPRPAAPGRLPRRPLGRPGVRPGALRPADPDGDEGLDLHQPRRRPPGAPARRRHPRRRGGHLPGHLRRGPPRGGGSAARRRRAAGARAAGRAGLRRPRHPWPAHPGRRVPVRQRAPQAGHGAGGRGAGSAVRGQRRRAARGHPPGHSARRHRRPARRLGPGQLRAAVPARDVRQRPHHGRARRRDAVGGARRRLGRAGDRHVGHPGDARQPDRGEAAARRADPDLGRGRGRQTRTGPGGHRSRATQGDRAEPAVRRMGVGRPAAGHRAGPRIQRPVQRDRAARLLRHGAVAARPGALASPRARISSPRWPA